MTMLEKYLAKTDFADHDDFKKNFEIIIPENFNFAYDVVDEWALTEPEKLAMRWVDDAEDCIDFTFSDLKKKSDQTAAYFQSLGIVKGDMVMLMLKGRFEFWYSILALHKLGAVTVPATHLLTKKDLIYRNNAASIKMVVAVGHKSVIENLESALNESPTVKHLVSVGPEVPNGWDDFTKGIEAAPSFQRPEVANTNDDISLIYFTSGTTADPKMAAHDYTYPLGHIVTASYWHNLNEESVHLTIADTGWGKAVWGRLYGQWIAGSVVFVSDYTRFVPLDMLKVIEKYNITSFCAPPTVYRFMIREDFSRYDLSSLNYCTVAGEPLSSEVFNKFFSLTGIKLMEGFGQTETTLTIATFPWIEPKPGSMGVPNPQYDVKLRNSEGEFCKAGEQGEIVINTKGKKPAGLFKTYHLDQKTTDATWYNDYYHTGDIASIDEDGYYWFVGRTDDMIKSSGYRIAPFEVESVLMTHDAVVESAVVGAPDDLRGQVIKATIVLADEYKPGDEVLMKEIQDHVKKTTAPYKYPRIIEFADALPKTISGKIKRIDLREK